MYHTPDRRLRTYRRRSRTIPYRPATVFVNRTHGSSRIGRNPSQNFDPRPWPSSSQRHRWIRRLAKETFERESARPATGVD